MSRCPVYEICLVMRTVSLTNDYNKRKDNINICLLLRCPIKMTERHTHWCTGASTCWRSSPHPHKHKYYDFNFEFDSRLSHMHADNNNFRRVRFGFSLIHLFHCFVSYILRDFVRMHSRYKCALMCQ